MDEKWSSCIVETNKILKSVKNKTTLYSEFPTLCFEWGPNEKTPLDYGCKSGESVNWKCEKGHVYDAVINNNKVLSQLGFEVEDFGNGTVLIRGVPQYIDHTNIKAAVEEIAGYLCDHKVDINTDSMDWIYHSMACRAAIKAGNINHEQELVQLVEILDNDDTIRYCPHGRPVSVVLTKRELEKQFGRV